MDIIEIRNNLVKLSYNEDEMPQLGQFLALTSDKKSYVAQFVNLKADDLNNFAVAKLLFIFDSEGIVMEYDGSIPTASYSISLLPPSELLNLLPIDTPIEIGKLASKDCVLNIDISVFEHNFTIFANNDSEKSVLISNFVRQLFRLKEKSVVVDIDGLFEDYSSLKLGKDFKLPLNSKMIDYIFEYELKDVDNTTKAIIQDIFYAVSQYINTLDEKFLPIADFIDVITNQYKETQMPELALLKNKLLKYQQKGIFANKSEDFKVLTDKLNKRNCTVVDLKNINGMLQKETIKYLHEILLHFDKYIYFFVPLCDDNSDKQLIKKLINNNHVFTTIFVPHSYKYASELKSHAQNMMFFAPQDLQHDFAAYNTFLNKLNMQEAVICGALTQGVPIIVTAEDLELDLTKDDVFGDREIFSPENRITENYIKEAIINPESEEELELELEPTPISTIEPVEESVSDNQLLKTTEIVVTDNDDISNDSSVSNQEPKINQNSDNVIQPIENIMSDDYDSVSSANESRVSDATSTFLGDDSNSYQDELTEDDLDFMEGNISETTSLDDLNINISESNDIYDEESVPVVPVYTPEEGEEISGDDIGYIKGERVTHPRYGEGVIEKIIKYGNKTLCSILFDNVGRRLLDPSISEFSKIS